MVSGGSSGGSRLAYGVLWAQREVACADDDAAAAAAAAAAAGTPPDELYDPVCAMPAPWIGLMAAG